MVRKTKPEDFSKVVPLLEEFENNSIKRSDWKRIFACKWNRDQESVGFHLEHQGKIEGFIGGIFSKRLINGRWNNLCNLTSWIVREDFRSHSVPLLMELLKVKDHTFTNFSATPEVSKVLLALGFRELESGFRIICPSVKLLLGSRSSKVSINGNPDVLDQRLKDDLLRIFDDHRETTLHPLLIEDERGQCLSFYKIVKRRRNVKAAHFLSASDHSIFNDQIDGVMRSILLKHGVFFAVLDNRFARTPRLRSIKARQLPVPMLFKSNSIEPAEVDYLYSEFALL